MFSDLSSKIVFVRDNDAFYSSHSETRESTPHLAPFPCVYHFDCQLQKYAAIIIISSITNHVLDTIAIQTTQVCIIFFLPLKKIHIENGKKRVVLTCNILVGRVTWLRKKNFHSFGVKNVDELMKRSWIFNHRVIRWIWCNTFLHLNPSTEKMFFSSCYVGKSVDVLNEFTKLQAQNVSFMDVLIFCWN